MRVDACSVSQSSPALCDPADYSPPGSSVHGISQQEYGSGVPFPTPGGLPCPGIEPVSTESPALAGRFFTSEPPGKPGRERCHLNVTPVVWPYSCVTCGGSGGWVFKDKSGCRGRFGGACNGPV